jgi:hypothetical protein
MKQVNDFRYEVVSGETITLVCTPFGIPPEVITAALDDGPIEPSPASPNPTYTFDASVPVDQTHFFKIECDFVRAPDTAKTVIAITGAKAGKSTGPFSVSILKADNIHDPTFRFKVVNAAS